MLSTTCFGSRPGHVVQSTHYRAVNSLSLSVARKSWYINAIFNILHQRVGTLQPLWRGCWWTYRTQGGPVYRDSPSCPPGATCSSCSSTCSAAPEKYLEVSFDLGRLQKGCFVNFLVQCVWNVRSKKAKCEIFAIFNRFDSVFVLLIFFLRLMSHFSIVNPSKSPILEKVHILRVFFSTLPLYNFFLLIYCWHTSITWHLDWQLPLYKKTTISDYHTLT